MSFPIPTPTRTVLDQRTYTLKVPGSARRMPRRAAVKEKRVFKTTPKRKVFLKKTQKHAVKRRVSEKDVLLNK